MLIETLIIFSLGLVFGSFITCASYRLPLELDVIKKPSYCPNCNAKLTFKDLWPFFSWLLSRGTCRHCGVKVSARYPLTELATGAIFLLIYWQYGATIQAAILALMAVMLLIMIVADLEHYIIPDCVHVVLLPLALAYRLASGTLSPELLWGFGAMVALALLLYFGYSKLRGRPMLGHGDVKFFAGVGVWLNIEQIPMFLLISGVLGVLLGMVWRALGKGQVFPFGPALAVSLFILVVYPSSSNMLDIIHQHLY